MMLKSRITIFTFAAVAITALAIGIFTQQSKWPAAKLPELGKVIILPVSKPLNGIDFLDHNGKPFTADRFKGYWSIVFFGFTNCPDVCPATMHTLKQVKDKVGLAGRWGNYQVVMVSVDPARDTPQQLAKYVPFFDPEFIGISGSLDITTEFARQMGILFVAREAEPNGSYDVDHGISLVLLNPKGEMAGVITAPHKADEIALDLIALADYYATDHQNVPIADVPDASTNADKPSANISTQSNPDSVLLQIENGWIRPAPPGVASMAAYFDLINNSSTAITIASAESPQFEAAMIHDTLLDNGIASMQHREQLVIPANGRVSFSPLATHMMLVGPAAPMPVGSKADISLILDDGQSFTQRIEVRAPSTPIN